MCKLSLFFVSMLVIAMVSGQQVLREKNNNDGSGKFDFTYASFDFPFGFIYVFFSVQKFIGKISHLPVFMQFGYLNHYQN